MRMRPAITASLVLAMGSGASAQQAPAQRPAALTRILDCRSLSTAAERLACFDREAAALEASVGKEELLVMDRQQLRKARRSVFGLTLPDLDLFGGKSEDEGSSRIETTIRSARETAGKWTIELADGARWQQVDSRVLGIDPRAGQKIVIRRASLGSFLANVNGQTAIRVRRVS